MSAKKSIKSASAASKPSKCAVKKTAAKKACSSEKKVAEADSKKSEKKCACSDSKVLGGLTRIIVKFNAGWGNNLYIRGNGAGLSWQKGVLMQCTDSDEWIWENKIAKGSIEYKILINDELWSLGEDFVANAGETVTVRPAFM